MTENKTQSKTCISLDKQMRYRQMVTQRRIPSCRYEFNAMKHFKHRPYDNDDLYDFIYDECTEEEKPRFNIRF